MRITPRHWLAALLLITVAAVLLYRTGYMGHEVDHHNDQLQSLRLGTLVLQPCEIGKPVHTLQAYCTEFSVPEDHAAEKGRRIKLKVAVVRSQAAQPSTELVTFLDGGPGGAATEDFPAIASAFAPLLKNHHVLLIDQRGTGGSNELDCPMFREEQRRRNEPDLLDANPAQAQQGLLSCLQEISQHADPQHYTTIDAIEDLEQVRQALGSPPLHVIGLSYGTRVAQQYATRFPEGVRSVVLDSAVPNPLALGQEHARNLEQALQAQFARCTADAQCQERFGDPYAQLRRLHAQLQAAPLVARVPDPNTFVQSERRLTAAKLATLVRLYAYNGATSALLPLMIDEALKGNFAPLLGQEQLVVDDVNSRITAAVGLSIGCTEDSDLLQTSAADRDTLLGNSLIDVFQSNCPLWPHHQRPIDFHHPFTTMLPVLVLAGELDPVTPPRYGEEIVKSLSNARLLIAPGQGHGIINVRCMPKLVERFISTLQPKALDASCLDKLQAPPAFLNYNGAAS